MRERGWCGMLPWLSMTTIFLQGRNIFGLDRLYPRLGIDHQMGNP